MTMRAVTRSAMVCIAAALATVPLASPAAAAVRSPGVELRDAWVRTPKDGYRSTVAFATIRASRDLVLVGARIEGFDDVKLKAQPRVGDMIVQQEVAGIPIAAGHDVELALGADRFHLMPVGLRRRVAEGDRLATTLRFVVPGARDAASTTVVRGTMVVRTPTGFHPHRAEDAH